MANFEVLIVGGGIVGCAFALDLCLRAPNLKIALIDQQPFTFKNTTLYDDRVYAISPVNQEYLTQLGAELDYTRINPIQKMEILSAEGAQLTLDAKSSTKPYLANIIEASNIYNALLTQLNSRCTLIKDKITAIEARQIFCQERVFSYDLLVGADGINSAVRTAFAININPHQYQQTAVIANFTSEYDHKNIAYQFFQTQAILALLPLPQQQVSMVYSHPRPDYLLGLKPEQLNLLIAKSTNYVLGNLKLNNTPLSFTLSTFVSDKLYHDNFMALIGDAAHRIHPLAGQGLNLGLAGSRSLVNNIINYGINKLSLQMYHASRMVEIKKIQLLCHTLQQCFASDNKIVKLTRNLGFNLLNKNYLIKKWLIEQAIN